MGLDFSVADALLNSLCQAVRNEEFCVTQMNWWFIKVSQRVMCKRTSINLKVVIFKWGMGKMTGNNGKEKRYGPKESKRGCKSSGEERKCQRNKDRDNVSQHNKEKAIFIFLIFLHPAFHLFSFFTLFSSSPFFFFCIWFMFITYNIHRTSSLSSEPRICKGLSAILTYVFLWFKKNFKIGLNLVERDDRGW